MDLDGVSTGGVDASEKEVLNLKRVAPQKLPKPNRKPDHGFQELSLLKLRGGGVVFFETNWTNSAPGIFPGSDFGSDIFRGLS